MVGRRPSASVRQPALVVEGDGKGMRPSDREGQGPLRGGDRREEVEEEPAGVVDTLTWEKAFGCHGWDEPRVEGCSSAHTGTMASDRRRKVPKVQHEEEYS